MIGSVIGGIGFFLLGMSLMTEGLKTAAGDALQRTLSRLTGGAWRAFLSGLLVTVLVQSSSATVLMTIGFVSAGLLTFTQTVGVVIGANLGTTSTGWIVSLLGFKVSMGTFAFPMVGAGAFVRLLAKGPWAAVGTAVAGFGTIFAGIDLLQSGMGSLSTVLDLGALPVHGIGGRALLVGVGFVMTVILQSSSVAVATTLTALHVGTVSLEQSLYLVTGQNVGTTLTAALAGLGASVPARRTAAAHILFNVVAAIAAFSIAPLYLMVTARMGVAGSSDASVTLAGFHTLFNLLGVLILLPLASRFAAVVERIVPDRRPRITRNLDLSVARIPAVATEAARKTVRKIGVTLAGQADAVLEGRPTAPRSGGVGAARDAMVEVRAFLREVRTPPELSAEHRRHLGVLHAMDHLERLADLLDEVPTPSRIAALEDSLPLAEARGALDEAIEWMSTGDGSPPERIVAVARQMATMRHDERHRLLERAARGDVAADEALPLIDAMRWVDAAVYHVWRSVHHLRGDAVDPTRTEAYPEPEPEPATW